MTVAPDYFCAYLFSNYAFDTLENLNLPQYIGATGDFFCQRMFFGCHSL